MARCDGVGHALASSGRRGSARLGMARNCQVWSGTVRSGVAGLERRGTASWCTACIGAAGVARHGAIWSGGVRHGGQDKARPGGERTGLARFGRSGEPWTGSERRGQAGPGVVRHGTDWQARRSLVRLGMVGYGWQATLGASWQGQLRRGSDGRRGMAGQRSERSGKAFLGAHRHGRRAMARYRPLRHGSDGRRGLAWRGQAGSGPDRYGRHGPPRWGRRWVWLREQRRG